MSSIKPCCGDYENCAEPCTPRGQWIATEALLNRKDTQTYFNGIPETKYTAPPNREWKGLTSDDKHFLLASAWNKEQAFDGFMDAIDKFLEEKNT